MFWPFKRIVEDHHVPPPVRIPKISLKPPKGFRFISDPPSLDAICHEDNYKPYRNAKRGEKLRIYFGLTSDKVVYGEVVGRMDASDPRAKGRHISPYTKGIYFVNERGELEWRNEGAFYREEDSVLRFQR